MYIVYILRSRLQRTTAMAICIIVRVLTFSLLSVEKNSSTVIFCKWTVAECHTKRAISWTWFCINCNVSQNIREQVSLLTIVTTSASESNFWLLITTTSYSKESPLDGAAKSPARPLAVVCGSFEVARARWCKRRAPKLHPQTHTPVSASLH